MFIAVIVLVTVSVYSVAVPNGDGPNEVLSAVSVISQHDGADSRVIVKVSLEWNMHARAGNENHRLCFAVTALPVGREGQTCVDIDPTVSMLDIGVNASLSSSHKQVLIAFLAGSDRLLLVQPLDHKCRRSSCLMSLLHSLLSPVSNGQQTTPILLSDELSPRNPAQLRFDAHLVRQCSASPHNQSKVLRLSMRFPGVQQQQHDDGIHNHTAAECDDQLSSISRFSVYLPNPLHGQPAVPRISSEADLQALLNAIRRRPGDSSSPIHGVLAGEQLTSFMAAMHNQSMSACRMHLHEVHSLCAEFAQQLDKSLFRQLLAVLMGLPSVQWQPQPTDAFVFLHMEKTAGTTLKHFMAASAEQLEMPAFVSCHGNVSCLTFTLPSCDPLQPSQLCGYSPGRALIQHMQTQRASPAVLAGHFSWGIWHQLPANSAVPAILSMHRHPFQRVLSQYYQRCRFGGSCQDINALGAEEFRKLLVNHRFSYRDEDLDRLLRRLRDKYSQHAPVDAFEEKELQLLQVMPEEYFEIVLLDEGMSNAACKMLAGKKVTSGLRLPYGHWTFQVDVQHYDLTPAIHPVDDDDLAAALTNLQHVTVGLQSSWAESVQLINHFFPWIDFHEDFQRMVLPSAEARDDNRVTVSTLRPDLLKVLEEENRCDLQLYEETVKRFRWQMLLLRI